MYSKIWDKPLEVLDYCERDISSSDARRIAEEWKDHKRKYKYLMLKDKFQK